MPLRKSHGPRAVALAALTAAVALAAPAAASAASLSQNLTCTAQSLSKPLAKWGDTADYWLAPGGDFETKAAGWTLKNAAVVSGNETLGVKSGKNALKFNVATGSATATTPTFCVDPLHPHFRFAVKTSSASALLKTEINFKTVDGITLTVPAKLNSYANGAWTLSESQPLSTSIPDVFLGTGTTASITFTSVVSSVGGNVAIDNLLIDPYRRG